MKEKLRALALPNPSLFMILLFGSLAASLVVIDPFLVNLLPASGTVSKSLRLYPYELSSIFIAFIFLLLISISVLKGKLDFDRSAIILILLSIHLVNITRIGNILEASDLVVGFFTLLLIIRIFMEDNVPIDKTLIMLNVIFICSILPSCVNVSPLTFFLAFAKVCKLALLSFLLAACIYKKNNIRFFIKWFVIFAVISSVIALLQQLIFKTTGILLVGLLDSSQTQINIEVNSLGVFYRFSGFVAGYKYFSNILVLALMLILNLFLYDKQESKKMQSILILSSMVMVVALIFTFSKDALLILVMGVLFSLLWKRPYLIFYFAGFSIFLLAISYVTGIFDKGIDALAAEITFGEFRIRRQFLTEGIHGFLKHPWVGVGLNKSTIYTSFFYRWPPHNGFLVALNETGIFGLGVFLAIIGYILHKSLLLTKLDLDLPYKWIMRAVYIGFITFILSINFHPTYTDNLIWIYLGSINAMYMHFIKAPNPVEFLEKVA